MVVVKYIKYEGAVAERLKATVLKTVLPLRVTGVRIPPAPFRNNELNDRD